MSESVACERDKKQANSKLICQTGRSVPYHALCRHTEYSDQTVSQTHRTDRIEVNRQTQ